MSPATWPCTVCGEPHSRRQPAGRRRATCSDECRHEAESIGSRIRDGRRCACRECRKLLTRKPGESPKDYAERKHCDRRCADRAKVGQRVKQVLPTERRMSDHAAAVLLARIPPRLLPALEELPAQERVRALEGWRVGV